MKFERVPDIWLLGSHGKTLSTLTRFSHMQLQHCCSTMAHDAIISMCWCVGKEGVRSCHPSSLRRFTLAAGKQVLKCFRSGNLDEAQHNWVATASVRMMRLVDNHELTLKILDHELD
jgi:hypothetical protein